MRCCCAACSSPAALLLRCPAALLHPAAALPCCSLGLPPQPVPAPAAAARPAAAHRRALRPADREHSTRSGEGDTEAQHEVDEEGGRAGGDEHQSFRQGLLRHFHKQSSAANLTRLANPAELRRLQEETRCVAGGGGAQSSSSTGLPCPGLCRAPATPRPHSRLHLCARLTPVPCPPLPCLLAGSCARRARRWRGSWRRRACAARRPRTECQHWRTRWCGSATPRAAPQTPLCGSRHRWAAARSRRRAAASERRRARRRRPPAARRLTAAVAAAPTPTSTGWPRRSRRLSCCGLSWQRSRQR